MTFTIAAAAISDLEVHGHPDDWTLLYEQMAPRTQQFFSIKANAGLNLLQISWMSRNRQVAECLVHYNPTHTLLPFKLVTYSYSPAANDHEIVIENWPGEEVEIVKGDPGSLLCLSMARSKKADFEKRTMAFNLGSSDGEYFVVVMTREQNNIAMAAATAIDAYFHQRHPPSILAFCKPE